MTDLPMEDWTGELGDRWLAHVATFESMIGPVGQALMAHAAVRPGESIVDTGCGCGGTSLELARQTGPDGRVTGFDIAPQLIAEARRRALASGLSNVRFDVGDAEFATPPDPPYDRVFSRFGVMFFNDTRRAFANMRQWLRPGGRVDFACWGPLERNHWFSAIGEVVGRHVELPARAPDQPGPFRLADPAVVTSMLEGAGFAGVRVVDWEGEQLVGGQGATPEMAVEFVMHGLDMRRLLEAKDPALLPRVRDELVAAFRPCYRDGSVRMRAAAWLVTANNRQAAA